MALWKKSEDPWDREPEVRQAPAPRQEPEKEAPRENPLERLRQQIEKRTAGGPEPDTPAMTCPWCGKEMARGYLYGKGGGDIWWLRKKLGWKEKLVGPDPNTSLLVSDEGGLYTYKTAWYCQACQRMAVDTTGIQRPYANSVLTAETAPAEGENEQEENP